MNLDMVFEILGHIYHHYYESMRGYFLSRFELYRFS